MLSFGSPVDTRSVDLFSLPEPVMEFAASGVAALMGRTGLPGWATREGFKLLGPVKTLRSRVKFLRQLHDREALLPHERQRRFVESEGWIAWPAPALADAMRQVIAQIRRACSPPEDGDYWLAGSADTLVTTVNGIVAGSAVEDARGALDAIDLSVTYAVPGPDGNDLAATAVTLRPGHSLDDAQGRPATESSSSIRSPAGTALCHSPNRAATTCQG